MSEFHFLRPIWLLALLVLLAVYWAAKRARLGVGDWSQICDPELLPHMLMDRPEQRLRWVLRREWLLAGGALAVIALAGPTWERLPSPAFRNDGALVIVLDLSPSMDANDVSPSRLERARFKIEDILKGRKDGQNALVVYGSDAFTVTPLTDDGATIVSQLGALATGLTPGDPGGHPETGLVLARKLLQQAGLVNGDILLISGGDGADDAIKAASEIREQGMRVSVLAVGTESGGPVPLTNGGFRQDSKGGIWVPKLDAIALQRVASVGNGRYQAVSGDDADLQALLPFFDRRERSSENTGASSMMLDQWQEQGPWLLVPLVPLTVLVFRRGYLAAWLLIALMPVPDRAFAVEWRDWFYSRDQQARQAYEQGDYARASELFGNPEWKAAAQYKAGQAEEAAKTLKNAASSDALYNQGNALAKASQYQQAVEAYERALKTDPQNEDAVHNKELVEAVLKKQHQQQQQGSGGDEKQQKQDQQKGQQQQADQQQGGGQQQDSQNSDAEQQKSEQQGEGPGPRDPRQQQAEEAASEKEGESKEADSQHAQQAKDDPKAKGEKQAQQQQAMQPGESKDGEQSEKKSNATKHRVSESEQASEQWLRRIPDDPGGLLKRKFQYQYQQRHQMRP